MLLASLVRLSRTGEFMLPCNHTIVSPQSTPLWLDCWGLGRPSIPKMVQGPRIELGSTDFQSVAEMTTLAHPALFYQIVLFQQ